MTAPYIPFCSPLIGEEEIREVISTLRSGWITTGARTLQFEREFKEYTGAAHALAVNSCTAGLHLALIACGIGPGDEVITTPLTFCATVNAILHVGATPVLADIDEDGNIDPQSIEERTAPEVKAIIPVHLAGQPCAMDAIWDLARRRRIHVIEDAAHAVGSRYRDEPVGAQSGRSDAVSFSFYATKNMTTGEGGMVTTSNRMLDERMRILALHGISTDAWKRYTREGNWFYEVLTPGFKYNLSDILSAIGIHQLRKLDQFIARRRNYAHLYNQLLGDIEELELPEERPDRLHAWHLYMMRLRLERLTIDRAEFIQALRARNIGTSVHFIPIPLHSFFKPWARLERNWCPRALALYPRLVSLPLYPGLRDEQVHHVASAIREVIFKARKTMFAAAGA